MKVDLRNILYPYDFDTCPVVLYSLNYEQYPSVFSAWGKDREATLKYIKSIRDKGYKEFYDEYLNIPKKNEPDQVILRDEGFFLLEDREVIIYYNTPITGSSSGVNIYFNSKKRSLVEDYIIELSALPRPTIKEEIGKISLVNLTQSGYLLNKYVAPKIDLNISLNYNDDFTEVHEKVLNKLKKEEPALYLFHGEPGTGKTSYLLYLMSLIGNKEVIYMSSDKTHYFSDPNFVDFLSARAKGSIIVIEDAEKILQSRENNPYSEGVSNILNLTDGIPGKLLNVQIICTFNSDFKSLDQALLRKGRLFQTYEFKKLQSEKAQKLSNNLGYDTTISKEMSLAEIFNQKDENGFEIKPKHAKVGFVR